MENMLGFDLPRQQKEKRMRFFVLPSHLADSSSFGMERTMGIVRFSMRGEGVSDRPDGEVTNATLTR